MSNSSFSTMVFRERYNHILHMLWFYWSSATWLKALVLVKYDKKNIIINSKSTYTVTHQDKQLTNNLHTTTLLLCYSMVLWVQYCCMCCTCSNKGRPFFSISTTATRQFIKTSPHIYFRAADRNATLYDSQSGLCLREVVMTQFERGGHEC